MLVRGDIHGIDCLDFVLRRSDDVVPRYAVVERHPYGENHGIEYKEERKRQC